MDAQAPAYSNGGCWEEKHCHHCDDPHDLAICLQYMAISSADCIECLYIGLMYRSEPEPVTHQVDGILQTAIQGFHPELADLKEAHLVLKQRMNALREMKLRRLLSLHKQAVVPLAYLIDGGQRRVRTLREIDDVFCEVVDTNEIEVRLFCTLLR